MIYFDYRFEHIFQLDGEKPPTLAHHNFSLRSEGVSHLDCDLNHPGVCGKELLNYQQVRMTRMPTSIAEIPERGLDTPWTLSE